MKGYDMVSVNGSHYGYDYEYQNAPLSESKLKKLGKVQASNRKITSLRVDKELPNNGISTSKYTFLTFIPKNLLEQFSKVANLYFLLIGLLQIVREISISEGIPTIYIPLSFIVVVSALKDFFEDYKRHKSDQEENNRTCKRYNTQTKEFETVTWSSILIEDKDQIPADVLILTTSEKKGLCYIETKSLDGETNLKQRNAQKDIYVYYGPSKNSEQLFEKTVIFSYELPNAQLHKFKGTCNIQGNDTAIDMNNFLLRGCKLRNTKWVLGLVSYTGHDTKMMKNSFNARVKRSHLERTMGIQIQVIFSLQILICFFCAIYYMSWYASHDDSVPYLKIDTSKSKDNSNAYNFFVRFGNWILIFNNFVPISLLVTLEMVKLFQAIQINKDESMVFTQIDDKGATVVTPTTVQSSNLNEELGQIEYVFSDKTGTLTCNIMEFKKLSINGISYGEPQSSEDAKYIKDISGFPSVTNVNFRDASLFEIIKDPKHPEFENVRKTLEILALTHTVITEEVEEQNLVEQQEIKSLSQEKRLNQRKKETVYNAASPDELALVNFAKYCGFEYNGIDEEQNMQYTELGALKSVVQLHVFDFDSTRKRQSVVIRDKATNKIWLYTKGADSVLFSLMDKSRSKSIEATENNLNDYGVIGLRTLLLCQREIAAEEYAQWAKIYHEACTTLQNREERMAQVQAQLEKNLVLVAATAIEDKLQDEVGSTISALKAAGIKVWVLTGDKVETAINIGFSCKLLTTELKQYIVKTKKELAESSDEVNKADILKQLKQIKAEIESSNHGVKYMQEQRQVQVGNDSSSGSNAFIITGEALIFAMTDELKQLLVEITNNCTSVLCCRVSPMQKQQIVSLVRVNKPTASTLAIGDGANDVNMISAAHVGVGIKGLEGQQAARASDYAIGEFKVLRNLLFFHGRESYRRNSKLVMYNYYKNAVLVLPQFFYSFYNNFSGQTLYDPYIYQLFNVFYSALPIIIFAVFDHDKSEKILIENKKNYYTPGPRRELFNWSVFWSTYASALYTSLILAMFSFQTMESSFSNTSGRTTDFWQSGTMVLGLVVINVNLKVLIISSDHSIGSIFINMLSMLVYLLTLISLSQSITFSSFYLLLGGLITSKALHIGNIVAIAATSFLDYFLELWARWNKELETLEEL